MLRGSSMTGLEITPKWLRVVALRETSTGIFVERLGARATPQEAVIGGQITDSAAVGRAVRTLYETHGIKTRSVVVGIPPYQLNSRISQVPNIPLEEMQVLVQGEAEHFRLVPPGEETFDYIRLHEALKTNVQDSVGRTRSSTTILLMAIEQQTADNCEQLAEEAGLSLAAVEPAPIACLRALQPLLISHPTTALVVVGARTCTLSVVKDGLLAFYRSIEGGAMRFTEGTGQIDMLAREVRQSLEFYYREMHTGEPVARVQLVLDPEFGEMQSLLASELELPVEVQHPFFNVNYDATKLTDSFLREAGPSFTTAFGLALRQMNDAVLTQRAVEAEAGAVPEQFRIPRMDLVRHEREKRIIRTNVRWLLTSAAVSVVIAALLGFARIPLTRYVDQRNSELAKVETQISDLNTRIQQGQKLYDRIATAVQRSQSEGTDYSVFLARLSSSLPDKVWITSISAQPDGGMKIEGMAPTPFHIASTLRRLGRLDPSLKPRLVSMGTQSSRSEGKTHSFDIELKAVGGPVGQPQP